MTRTGQLELTWSFEDALSRDAEWVGAAALYIASRPIGATFTADTLTGALGRPHGPSGAAVGAVFKASSKRGEIRCVGFTPSLRPDRHRNMVRIWERV